MMDVSGMDGRRAAAWLSLLVVVGLLGSTGLAGGAPPGTRVQTYARNLALPVDMAWDEGTDRMFFTERKTGKVRVLVGGRLLSRPCVDLAVNSEGNRGAQGLVLSPNFDANHHLYVFYTNASPLENRVSRFTVQNNRCRNRRNIVTGLSPGNSHHGAHLAIIGSKLFVSTGDHDDPSVSQDTSDRAGKILRYNLNGSIPAGNPFENAVWSYGLRNPYGLAHRPGTSQLFATDNGPDCDDELNEIVEGRNYGWGPNYTCGSIGVGPNPKAPLFRWSDSVAPTDATWYVGSLETISGALIVGDFLQGRLHRFALNAAGDQVVQHSVLHDSPEPVIDVTEGPGGWLYFSSQTTIYRIVPQA